MYIYYSMLRVTVIAFCCLLSTYRIVNLKLLNSCIVITRFILSQIHYSTEKLDLSDRHKVDYNILVEISV